MDEMHNTEWLTKRILFFEGVPTVFKLNPTKIGKTVSEMISNNDKDEPEVVNACNKAIKIARVVEYQGTVNLLPKILKMEEVHVESGWHKTYADGKLSGQLIR
jgi:bacterioferritin